jgi:hypothetical protein
MPRKTDIAELALIKVGKRAQGSSTFPPSFERCMQRQQGVDSQQYDVIVSQKNRRCLVGRSAIAPLFDLRSLGDAVLDESVA